ncbi:MAG TPA: tetratricopeptide repeat protein [Accumulibacter sp.]|nr:tetratricopeptide repeat protein [Accumulibacter sp.]
MKPGRNDPCPCGSGRKYKNCCLGQGAAEPAQRHQLTLPPDAVDARQLVAMFQAGRHAELESWLHLLVRQSPQSGFLWGLLGASLQAQGKDGVPALQRATTLAPGDFDAQTALGRAFIERGLFDAAATSFERAALIQPGNAGAQFALGDSLRLSGRFAEAEACLRGVLRSAPDSAELLVCLADTLGELGRLDEAEAFSRRAAQRAPEYPAAHFCLGNILCKSGRLEEAGNCFAAALQRAPDYVPALDNLGNVLQELGSLVKAEECYRRALQLAPGYVNACTNLARLLVDQTRFAEAERCYRDALKAQPANAEILERLGGVLVELGRAKEAESCYLQALDAQPDRATTRLALATAALPVIVHTSAEAAAVPNAFAAALATLSDWLHADPGRQIRAADLAGAQQPFFLAYRDGNHVDLLSRYGDLVAECLPPRERAPRPHRDRTRLLVVSHHVRRHSVWDIVLRGLLLHLDRTRFEVLIYHLGNAEDEETAFARTQVDGWRDRHTIGEASGWLAAAGQDCPDVIFYPEIGMSSIAYFLAAHRLAPLQVASWGHPITTGLASIDLFLSGDLLEPANADAHYRERLIRLPGTGCCTASLPIAAEPIPEVEAALHGLDGRRFLIAQRSIKLDPVDDDLYAQIAVAAGSSVFILLRDPVCPWATDQVMARLESVFRKRGIDPTRHLLLIPWLSPGKFLALLDLCDVFLDCPAFSGYTTAWQALHRGLPIVTREGRHMRQRLASGLLRKAGLADNIASSTDDYIRIATRLAGECRDAGRRTALRAAVLAAAPAVDDDVSVVRSFESCLLAELDVARRAEVTGSRHASDRST